MKTLNAVLLAGVVLTLVPQTSDAMEKFLKGLPNGSKFKKTLGHKGENGFTPFGGMFSGTWSASLCKDKFPGSNTTVGQVFGDPCCTWSEGGEPDFEVTFTDDFPAQSTKTCATTSGRATAGIGSTSTSGGDAGAKASGESKSNTKASSANVAAQVGGTRKIHIPNLGGNKPPVGGGSPPNGNSGGNGGGSNPPGGGNQPPGGAKPPPGGGNPPPGGGNPNSSSGNVPSGPSAGKSGGGNKSSAGGKSRSFDLLRYPSFRGNSNGSLSPSAGVHTHNSATAGENN